MMKRLSLLLAALFVAATLFAAPVIASGNGDNGNNDRVCVLHDEDNGKDYQWAWDVEDLHVGDEIVDDKYCEDDNGNGDHNGNGDNHHNGN